MSDRTNPAVQFLERLALRQQRNETVVRAERPLANLIQERDVKRWMVFEGDWGGQIYASIPLSMLPLDFTVANANDLLKDFEKAEWESNEGEGGSWYIVQDCGVINRRHVEDVALEAMLPGNVQPADMCRVPLTDFTPRLEGWVLVGNVMGGMGGGGLLEGDVWFHHDFLRKGLVELNRLRFRLRLAPLDALGLVERVYEDDDELDDEDD